MGQLLFATNASHNGNGMWVIGLWKYLQQKWTRRFLRERNHQQQHSKSITQTQYNHSPTAESHYSTCSSCYNKTMKAKCKCGCTKFFDGPYREEQWLVVCIKCLTLYQLNPQSAKLTLVQTQLNEKERIEYTLMCQQGKKAKSYQTEN